MCVRGRTEQKKMSENRKARSCDRETPGDVVKLLGDIGFLQVSPTPADIMAGFYSIPVDLCHSNHCGTLLVGPSHKTDLINI